jgi:CheY-like chemotaxis protein
MRPKKIILCVDDNEQTLSVRKFLLETKGYRVLSATSGHEALEIVEKYAPGELSLLISDLLMPQMDGVELIRRVREMQPGLPSLMISGTVTSYERGVGADVFLPKGACSPSELLERVRVLVARKRGPKKGSHRVPVMPQVAEHQVAA